METPLTKLIAIAIRHIEEQPDKLVRADMLDAAASVFLVSGEPQRAQQLTTTAAILREAANAQLMLKSLFA